MVNLSKEEFYAVMSNRGCDQFVHPQCKGCIRAALELLLIAGIGCMKFSGTLCLLQIAIKGKNITREQLYNILEYGARLSACGVGLSLIMTTGMCLLRNYGGLNYYTLLTIPGFMSGLSIFILRRSRRHIFISALACSSLETLVSFMRKNRKTDPLKLTAIFMLTNSLFMYFLKLWKSNRTGHAMPELWFFAPSHQSKTMNNSAEENYEEKRRRPCSHIQSCIRSILKESSNYFCYGILIEVLRIMSAKMKMFARNPWKLVPFLCKPSTLRVATFAGLYVFLFKVTHCTLCKIDGKDRPLNSLIAGLISGTSVYVYPKDTLIITVFVNLVHVMWRYYGINQKYLRNFYTSEFLFLLFCAFLFHVRVMMPDHCPRFFINMISFASIGRADIMVESFYKFVREYRLRHA